MQAWRRTLRPYVPGWRRCRQDTDDVLPPESWDWAEGVEAVDKWAAERMAQEEEAIHHALSSSSSSSTVLSHRPGEEENALRAEAARVGARRADAEEIAAAARRLRETDLRRLAADAETGSYSYILMLTHEELTAVTARMEVVAVGMEAWMACLAARLTRGAAEFAARPGEEAFVAAMRKEAAKADEARSALARYQAAAAAAAGSLHPAGGGAGAGLQAARAS